MAMSVRGLGSFQNRLRRSEQKLSISREDAVRQMYALHEAGSSYAEAYRKVHEQFDVVNTPDEIEIGVDEGVPGSDRTVYAVMSGDGRVLGRYNTKEEAAEYIRVRDTPGEISEEPFDDSENLSRFDIIDIE